MAKRYPNGIKKEYADSSIALNGDLDMYDEFHILGEAGAEEIYAYYLIDGFSNDDGTLDRKAALAFIARHPKPDMEKLEEVLSEDGDLREFELWEWDE